MAGKYNKHKQDGSHLGFPIRMILATVDLQVTSILSMNFESVQEKKFKTRFSRWPPQPQFGIPYRNDLSYFSFTSHLPSSTRREQEAHGPWFAHLSDITTADMQMLCNIFPILSSQQKDQCEIWGELAKWFLMNHGFIHVNSTVAGNYNKYKQDDGHLRFPIRTILTTVDLQVTSILSI